MLEDSLAVARDRIITLEAEIERVRASDLNEKLDQADRELESLKLERDRNKHRAEADWAELSKALYSDAGFSSNEKAEVNKSIRDMIMEVRFLRDEVQKRTEGPLVECPVTSNEYIDLRTSLDILAEFEQQTVQSHDQVGDSHLSTVEAEVDFLQITAIEDNQGTFEPPGTEAYAMSLEQTTPNITINPAYPSSPPANSSPLTDPPESPSPSLGEREEVVFGSQFHVSDDSDAYLKGAAAFNDDSVQQILAMLPADSSLPNSHGLEQIPEISQTPGGRHTTITDGHIPTIFSPEIKEDCGSPSGAKQDPQIAICEAKSSSHYFPAPPPNKGKSTRSRPQPPVPTSSLAIGHKPQRIDSLLPNQESSSRISDDVQVPSSHMSDKKTPSPTARKKRTRSSTCNVAKPAVEPTLDTGNKKPTPSSKLVHKRPRLERKVSSQHELSSGLEGVTSHRIANSSLDPSESYVPPSQTVPGPKPRATKRTTRRR